MADDEKVLEVPPRPPTDQVLADQAVPTEAPAKKAPAAKAVPKRSAANKVSAKKAPARKAVPKKAAAKKAPAKKAVPKKASAKKAAPAKQTAARKKVAAQKRAVSAGKDEAPTSSGAFERPASGAPAATPIDASDPSLSPVASPPPPPAGAPASVPTAATTPHRERARPAPTKLRASGTARKALLLAVLSFPLLGVPGIVALALASRAKRESTESRGEPEQARRTVRTARLARIIAVIGLLGWLGVGVAVALEVTDEDGVDYASLDVGDCFETPDANEVRGVEITPCSRPHDAEVYFIVNHPARRGAPYPGVQALVEFAGDSCLGQAFTDYVGVPRTQSTLKNLEVVPQQSAWDDGRRRMICAVDNGGERVVGSVRGSSR